jgi:drug/metabolite transporter (DMT)-like permease
VKNNSYQWYGLFVIPLVVALGQILFKMTAVANSGQGIAGLLTNVTFWIAIVLYGAATLAWIPTIESVPITRAYFFMALTYLYVPALSAIFLHETISVRVWLGTAVVIAGITIAASG